MKNVIILGFAWVLITAGVANSATTTITYQVSASADDGYALSTNKEIQDLNGGFLISLLQAEEAYSTFYTESETTPGCDGWAWAQGQQTLDSDSLYIGTNNRDYFVPYPISAMRFSMLGIFRGMEVITANIRIYTGDEMNDGKVFGVIHGGLPGWPYVFQDISQIEKTQASVDWDHTDAWQPNTWYYSPDLTNIVQELINKPDWKAGHPMTMVYSTSRKSSHLRSFLSSEMGYDFAPRLKIRFRACVIFGYVRTAEGEPIQWATIDGGDDLEKRISSSDGSYQFFVPPGWSGTLTVSKDDILFKPAQYTYTNLNTHMYEQNFIEYKPKISGFILDKYGEGLEQANISANNGGASGVSDANGFYEIIVPLNWSGTVTVNKPGWKIIPQQVSYSNLVTDQNDQNYSAYQPTISGQVKDEEGLALEAVQVDIEGVGALLTDPNGQYQIDVPYFWSGKITASMIDWGFLPYYRSYYNLTTDRTNQDFTSFQPKISGYVRKSDGSAIVQATLQASNGGPSALTNGDGYYEITVPYYWSGVISISKDQMPFTPEERTYSNITGNWSNQNYTVIDPKISGYVRRDNGSAVASVTVQANNGGGSVVTDSDGYYELTVLYNWSGVVTPNKVGCTFDPANRSYTDVTADLSNQDYLGFIGTIYVDKDGAGDFTTIQDAIDAAIDGHTIIVNPGTYTGNGNWDIDFLGKAITVRGATGDPNDCIVNCQGTLTAPHRGFTFVRGEGANSVLEAITIINGYGLKENAPGTTNRYYMGGAIYCALSSPTITNCIITNNAAYYGGGICNRYNSSPTIKQCTISNNLANRAYGGGIYNYYSNPIIINCAIINNTAFEGGGISNDDHSEPNISNCIISNNSSTSYGGGVYNTNYSKTSINNCTLCNNSAGSSGGGISNVNWSSLRLYNSILWGNQPSQIYGTPTVIFSDIQGGYTGVGNIDVNPCFVDPDTNDFHLTGVSLCIDAGDANYIPDLNETDIDGDPRVMARIDMGADEVSSSTSGLLVIIPGTLDFEAEGLNSGTQSQQISIRNYGAGVLNWQLSEPNDCDWLSEFPVMGQVNTAESNDVEITVNPNIAGYGTNSCQLQVTAPDAENSPQVVTFNLEVLGPQISVNDDYFYFTAYGKSDTSVAGQELVITNTGFDTLNWHIEIPDCNWLSVAPQSGQVTDGNSVVTLTVDPNKAPAYGYNYCTINIIDENASNSPKLITVRLNVLGPSIYVNPSKGLYIYAESNTKVEGTFEIINIGYDILHWNIETPNDCNWLTSVEPLSGECAAEESDIVTITVDANGLENNDYYTQLLIHSPECSSRTVILHLIVYTPEEIHVPQDYQTIQAAIDAALTGNVIVVHPGKYAGFIADKPALTIRSLNPENPTVVAATIIESRAHVYSDETLINGLSFIYNPAADPFDGIYISSNARIENCRIMNFPSAGIRISERHPQPQVTISNCVISNNGYRYLPYMSGIITNGSANIENCLITGNFGGGILVRSSYAPAGSWIYINNTTIADNFSDTTKTSGRGIICDYYYPGLTMSLQNSIISNALGPNGAEIFISDDNFDNINLEIAYSNVRGGSMAVSVPNDVNFVWGVGNIDADPCFVAPGYWDTNGTPEDSNDDFWVDGDYHLKSQGWRPDAQRKVWTWDDVTSRCIDAGNPGSPLGNELITIPDDPNNIWGQNLRINMGAYGGTAEASMPPYDWAILADLTNDGLVNLKDYAYQAADWLNSADQQPGDLNRDSLIYISDLALLVEDWLKQTTWH